MIYIIRHGQTELNAARIMQGKSNYPLNETGIAQAEEAAEWFQKHNITFDRIFSSPLKRAIQTAEIVTGGSVPIKTDERLVEMDYGPYDGISLVDPPEELVRFLSDFKNVPAPEGMEPLADVVKRGGDFIESVKEECAEGNTLIATHAIAMKGILEYLIPEADFSTWGKKISNCGIYKFDLIDGVYTTPEEVVR